MTVIIIGAGASTELCIPSGKGLLRELISRLCTAQNYNEDGVFKRDSSKRHPWGKYRIDLINQLLKHHSKLTNENDYYQTGEEEGKFIYAINSFKEDLEKYIHNNAGSSIDAFLACHNKPFYQEIGMFILAYHFIGYEAHSVRESCYCKENWLRIFIESHLRNKIRNGQSDLGLKVITFNYERLIEHHIYNFLTNSMSINSQDAARIVEQELMVVHVYGKIADLPWQSNATKPMDFGARNDDVKFLHWAKAGIKLIGWRIKEDVQNTINKIIDSGDRFFLLGFGFDKDNMRILNLLKNKSIIGTGYGINDDMRTEIRKCYGLNNIEFMSEAMTCAEFVRSENFSL